jgi:hypothetical protein
MLIRYSRLGHRRAIGPPACHCEDKAFGNEVWVFLEAWPVARFIACVVDEPRAGFQSMIKAFGLAGQTILHWPSFLPRGAFRDFRGYRTNVVFAIVDQLRLGFSDDFELFGQNDFVFGEFVESCVCLYDSGMKRTVHFGSIGISR